MAFIKNLFNYLGFNCFLRKHNWIKCGDSDICSRCPAIRVKIGNKFKVL